MSYDKANLEGFFSAVDSLKKYRRAELSDNEGNTLIDDLYTDLLPKNQILNSCLKDNTTFLIGRKGTGKSTIFLKLQQEIRKDQKTISCYIDTFSIYDSSRSEFISLDYLKDIIPQNVLQNYLLERNFLQNVLKDIKEELDKKSQPILSQIKKLLGLDKSDIVREKLEKLSECIDNNEKLKSIEIPLLKQIQTTLSSANENTNTSTESSSSSLGANVSLTNPSASVSYGDNQSQSASHSTQGAFEKKYSEILLQLFSIKDIIIEIKDILSILEIKKLYILLDDFSEIDDTSMQTFVDVLLAPLNNWSDEFIKFKVAAYPNRVYYGRIDKGKIDILDLDFYNLYSEFDRSTMEERAIDFTKRLVNKRIEYFTNQSFEYFFDTSKDTIENYYELLFQISMNVPRIIGYILYYCYESNMIFDKPINRSALISASQKYYTKIICSFFEKTTYSRMAFDEKISILQLKELLGVFISELSDIRKRIITNDLSGSVYELYKTNPFTSHFYFSPTYEKFISTLELNFFISKYDEMSDRDGSKQSIYSLNFGLCSESNLRWGKPQGSKHRKYFISRPFDFNKLIQSFLESSKKIICSNPSCSKIYSFDQLKFFEFNKMICPECHNKVEIVSNADALSTELRKIDNTKLLPKIEFSILYELHNSDEPLRPKEIAQELDCSYQLIGRKAKILDEDRQLLKRDTDTNGNRIYILTDKSKQEYFIN